VRREDLVALIQANLGRRAALTATWSEGPATVEVVIRALTRANDGDWLDYVPSKRPPGCLGWLAVWATAGIRLGEIGDLRILPDGPT
jgi:hypothetical protein